MYELFIIDFLLHFMHFTIDAVTLMSKTAAALSSPYSQRTTHKRLFEIEKWNLSQ